jgi:N-formylglutamate amidohydrolase
MNALNNTILGMDLFEDEIRNSFLFHIPHSSIKVPKSSFINNEYPDSEILKYTDWLTDKIFDVENIKRVTFDYSRVYCDVERFYPDEKEYMHKFGRGFYYTKTDDNKLMRTLDDKDNVYEIYKNYHNGFNGVVQNILDEVGVVHIIDCHSFSNIPAPFDNDDGSGRPDICIGTDDFHTPSYLIDLLYLHFKSNGFDVQINMPYSGSIVPNRFYCKNKSVKSIMVEINKRLYMDESSYSVLPQKVIELNRVISNLFSL